MTMNDVPVAVPGLLTIEEAAVVLRIGRTCAYELARQFTATGGRDGLPVIRVGCLLRVPRIALEQMIGGPITWPVVDLEAELSHRVAPVTSPTRRHAGFAPLSRSGQSSLPFSA